MLQSLDRCRPVALAVLISLTAGLFTLWPFLVHGGIPGYQHDWSWPLFTARGCEALHELGSTWTDDGLGHANPFATANPIPYFIAGSSCALGPEVSIRLYLLAIILVAGFGMYVLCSAIGLGDAPAFVGVFFYLCAPPMFNKVTAGHVAFWSAFALFPWVFWSLWRLVKEPNIFRAAVAAFVMALSYVQPQFYVFDVLVAGSMVLAYASARSALWSGGGVLLSWLMSAPAVVAAFTLMPAFRATVPHPLIPFETIQSAAPFDAARLMGYISGYAERAYSFAPIGVLANTALTLICALAAVGLFFLAPRLRIAAVSLALTGFCILSGLKGPAAPLFSWLFVHVAATAILREFYHAAPLLLLPYSIALALLASRSHAVAIGLSALGVFALFPMAIPGHALDLQFLTVPSQVRESVRDITKLRPSRFLPLPFKMPLRYKFSTQSGVDGFAYVDAMHPSVAEYAPTPRLDAIAALAADGDTSAAREDLGRLGVVAVVYRTMLSPVVSESLRSWGVPVNEKVVQGVFGGPGLFRALTGVSCSAPVCSARLAASSAGFVGIARRVAPLPFSLLDETPGITYVDRSPIGRLTPHLSALNLSPYEGWVSSRDWMWLRTQWSAMNNVFAVTLAASTLRLDVSSPAIVTYSAGAGGLRACERRFCISLPATNAPRAIPLAHGSWRITSASSAAIGESTDAPDLAGVRDHAKLTKWKRIAPFAYSAEITGEGTALLTLRNQYDSGWSLSGRSAKHVRVDGYANGWLLSLHGKSAVTLQYDPQNAFKEMLVVSMIVYLTVVLIIALHFYRTLGSTP